MICTVFCIFFIVVVVFSIVSVVLIDLHFFSDFFLLSIVASENELFILGPLSINVIDADEMTVGSPKSLSLKKIKDDRIDDNFHNTCISTHGMTPSTGSKSLSSVYCIASFRYVLKISSPNSGGSSSPCSYEIKGFL